jgi:hypothetical protein
MKIIKVILVLIGMALIFVLGSFTLSFFEHKKPIPENAVSMDYPLKNRSYTVVQSGKFWNIHNSSQEKYALDITKISDFKSWFNFRKTGLESDPSFGATIYSPCQGNIKKIEQNFPDMPIGIKGSTNEANFILIACDNYNVSLIHFKKDSILVRPGDTVSTGQPLGQIGNSGFSDEPHLHIAAYKVDSQTLESTNIPILFKSKYFHRGDSFNN